MALTLREYYAYWAAKLLKDDLLPLALETAALPADTSLAVLRALNLPRPEPEVERATPETRAAVDCADCLLFAAVLLADELCRIPLDKAVADLDEARRIASCILGLIWRDALACARISERENALDHCLEGADEAEAHWQKWLQTEDRVKEAQASFLKRCASDLYY